MADQKGTARSCEMCLTWAVMHWSRICQGCKAWKRAYPERGRCPRCRHDAHLNTDGLCRPCLQAIRLEDDSEWALGLDEARPRDLQLLVGLYRDYSTISRPLVRGKVGKRRVREDWRLKLAQQQLAAEESPVILASAWPGQAPLFTAPRTLTKDTVSAVSGRPVADWERARGALTQMAAELGLTAGWQFKVAAMLRLALAVREAEGVELLPERFLCDLPGNGDAVRLVLLRAGLLEPAPEPMRFSGRTQPTRTAAYFADLAPLPPREPRSCRDCDAWIHGEYRNGARCNPCRHWRERADELHGQCCRCRRDGLALRDGRCRGCSPYRVWDEAWPGSSRATQLVIDLPSGVVGPTPPYPIPDSPKDEEQPPALRSVRGEQELFFARRDWNPVLARSRSRGWADLPLTASARRVVDEFDRIRQRQSVDYTKNIRTLTILMYWLGAVTAVHERDVHDLAQLDPNLAAKPVCQYLNARGLLIEDPALHRNADQAYVESTVQALTETIGSEVQVWVDVRRDPARNGGEASGWDGIRRYLVTLQPTLAAWSGAGTTTLRQVTSAQVEAALDGLIGHTRRQLAIALRSLFRALKRERVIFRDPTRTLPVGDIKGLPRSIPSDVLAGLLDTAGSPFGRLVIALTAVHALPGHEITKLTLGGLDLARGTLESSRGQLRHTLYLEEFTHELAADWLTYRYRRWPTSSNPHLLISQKTAFDSNQPAVSTGMLRKVLPPGVTLAGLRQDRILNEALETADPLRLMRLFGIAAGTAMRYVAAAHPERTAKTTR